ncbi:MAG: hypothetical protein ABSE90_07175 [Verrucomicrobiota bacterium]|jgi:hypothetical protein
MNSEPYELIKGFPGWIKVCAWCYPGEKIFDTFPDLRGKVQISHSVCPAHKKAVIGGILARCRKIETIMPDGHTEAINLHALKG